MPVNWDIRYKLYMFCCDKRELPQFALNEVNSLRYEIAFIDLEFMDYSRGRTAFKWPFKGYLFFVQSVQDTPTSNRRGPEDTEVRGSKHGPRVCTVQCNPYRLQQRTRIRWPHLVYCKICWRSPYPVSSLTRVYKDPSTTLSMNNSATLNLGIRWTQDNSTPTRWWFRLLNYEMRPGIRVYTCAPKVSQSPRLPKVEGCGACRWCRAPHANKKSCMCFFKNELSNCKQL